MIVHFLHIGKTGGTAIKHALLPVLDTARHEIKLHDHGTMLSQVPAGEQAVFFVRDPIARFVSGFYSRQRQGRPRYEVPWNEGERAAFERFHTPNQLAVALSAAEERQHRAASDAMRSIVHVRSSYWNWFQNQSYFRSRIPDLFFVGFQEHLQVDFERLKRKLRLPETLQLPGDDLQAHRNPRELDTNLEETSVENLQRWYAADFVFLELCRTVAQDINQADGMGVGGLSCPQFAYPKLVRS